MWRSIIILTFVLTITSCSKNEPAYIKDEVKDPYKLYQEGFVDESGYYWKTRKTYSEEGKLEKEETFKDGDVIESKEY